MKKFDVFSKDKIKINTIVCGDDFIFDNEYIYIEVTDKESPFEYQNKRAAEYPPCSEYLDGIVKNDAVQIQNYIDACLAVKAKYPKPGIDQTAVLNQWMNDALNNFAAENNYASFERIFEVGIGSHVALATIKRDTLKSSIDSFCSDIAIGLRQPFENWDEVQEQCVYFGWPDLPNFE